MKTTKTAIARAARSAACLYSVAAITGSLAWAQDGGGAAIDASAAPAAAPEAAIVPTIAVATRDAPPLAAAAPIADDRQIAEVVVTATKREASLRDIPASIAAFDGATLETQGKLNLNDYVQETPGVVANSSSPGLIRVTMRGIATDTNPTSATPSAVGILIGDTAFSDPYIAGVTPDLSAFDLSSVQVLKGPQGTLFGGAALSGAVRYVLQDPVLDTFQARAFSQYVDAHDGSDAFTSGVAVNLPWARQNLALRVGYVKREYPGVYDDARSGRKNVDDGGGDQWRAILLWQPTERLKVKLTHLAQDFDADNVATIADSRNGPRATDQLLLPEPANNKFSLESLELNYDFDTMRAVSLSSYNKKQLYVFHDVTATLAGSPPPGYPQAAAVFDQFSDNSHSFAQELRLQSTGTGDFQWLVGGYFYDYSVDFALLYDTLINQSLSGQGSLIDQLTGLLGGDASRINQETALLYAATNAKSQEKALFFDLTQTLWDDLEVSAGARLYETFVDGGFLGSGVLVRAANNGADADLRNRINEKGISPKFAVTYHFDKDILAYTSASRGFRFGGIQSVPSTPTNGVPPTYKSDSLWNYELGVRSSWFDNTLHVDVTGFYIDYKNPQIIQQTQGIPLSYYDNVSAAISKGFEASILWRPPVRGLTLAVSGGKTDAQITKDFAASDGSDVPSGTQLPGAADYQYNAEARYFMLLGMIGVDSTVGYTYIGKGYGDITHTQAINDYGTLNAGVSFSSDAWSVKPKLSVNVSNILNETAPVSGTTANSLIGTPVTFFTLNPPRTLSVRLSLEF